jgi:hypothetical protein
VTYYNALTTDAILAVSVAPSTGYLQAFKNAGEFANSGWEVSATANVVETDMIGWDINAQWARNRSCTRELAGTEEFSLTGFTGSTNSVVAPRTDRADAYTSCEFTKDGVKYYGYPIGVHYTDDFIRFGRGSVSDEGYDIDNDFTGWSNDNVYIGDNGYPQYDPQSRVTGDANPNWTASFRNNIRIGNDLRISALLDVKNGGQTWNGTKGALWYFGTHADTEPYHGAGTTRTFGQDFYTDFEFAGPGLGTAVPIDVDWFTSNIGSTFTGPAGQVIEDSGFMKLRDVSIAYTLRNQDWLSRIGFSTLDIQLVGRNLATWTDYTGIDPESNLDGQTLGRGIDYFNNPQTRSFGVNLTITR